MGSKKNFLVGAALAGLILSTAQAEDKTAAKGSDNDQVSCYGVNACKGHGQCAGKVDSCGGKNSCDTVTSCGGKNSCKGKGIVKLSKKECLEKKGKIATAMM
ncbi:MAG: hypothetical protein ACOYL6_12965 [Bacteriovoracaceae bacterium]